MCEEISHAQWLLRGIPERELDSATHEITSFSFNSAELSVRTLSRESVQALLASGHYVWLAAVNVAYCRSIGLEVRPDPLPEIPDHALILMSSGRSSRATKLKRHAVRVPITGSPEDAYERLVAAIDATVTLER